MNYEGGGERRGKGRRGIASLVLARYEIFSWNQSGSRVRASWKDVLVEVKERQTDRRIDGKSMCVSV